MLMFDVIFSGCWRCKKYVCYPSFDVLLFEGCSQLCTDRGCEQIFDAVLIDKSTSLLQQKSSWQFDEDSAVRIGSCKQKQSRSYTSERFLTLR